MNMISTGAFQTEMDASNRQHTLAKKFAAVWEKKNAKAARAGGVSLMALSLAACGSDDTTTTASTATTTTTTTTTTVAAQNSNFTTAIDSLTGGAGDDTFVGDNNTSTEADAVDGGAGSDLVKLYNVGTTGVPTMTNVESVWIKGMAANLDTSANSVTSVELVAYDLSAARTVKLADDTTLTITDTTGTANAITLSNNTETAQTINMSGSGDKTNAIDIDVDGDLVTTLNLAAGAEASFANIANTGAALATVNISGASNMTVENVATATAINITNTAKTAVDTAVAKVVVTGGAGADTVTLDHATGTAREFTVNTGAGDDKISLNAMVATADLTDSKVTISAGAGTDTLAMKAAMGAVLSGLTAANFAKKGIANEFEKIEIIDAAAAGNALGLARVGSNVTTVDYSAGLGHASQTLTGLASGGTIILGAAASQTPDKNTVTVKDSAAAGAISDVLNITLDGAHTTTSLDYGIVTAANVETININSTSTKATALVAANTNVFDMIIANATTVNVTGNVYADLDGDPYNGAIAVVDASANTAGAAIDVTGAAGAVKITGTAKADALTGGSGADVIDGGAGNDTVTGGTGNDTLTGGAGVDQLIGGTGADLITLVAGSIDTVQFTQVSTAAVADGQGFDGTDTDGVLNGTTEDLTESTATALSSGDFISGFVIGEDVIGINGALETMIDGTGSTTQHITAGVTTDVSANGYFVVDNAVTTVADFGDLSAVGASINAAFTTDHNGANNDEMIIMFANTLNTQHAVYFYKDADENGTFGTGDGLSLLAIIDTAGDMTAASLADV